MDTGKIFSDWKLASYFSPIYQHLGNYYTGQDLLPLSRQRHREKIIYYRKVCTKMGLLTLALFLLGIGATLRPCHAQESNDEPRGAPPGTLNNAQRSTIAPIEKLGHGNVANLTKPNSVWQPDDWDWESMRALSGPKETWKGLYVNITENKHAAAVLTPEKAHFRVLPKVGNATGTGKSTDLALVEPNEKILPVLAWFAGISWATAAEVAGVAVGIWGAVSAIQGCVTDDGSNWGTFNCIGGILGTVIGIGTAAKATYAGLKGLGWFARSSATWLGSGLEAVELGVFSKRDIDPNVYQKFHDKLLGYTLNQTFGRSEFIGYASENHRLGARHDEHRHPHAPIFRVRHPRHGYMDIASREHKTGSRYTITYANGLDNRRDRLGRRQTFQHEALNGAVLEVKFDTGAAEADLCNRTFDAAAAFDELESEIQCFTGGNWPDNSIIKFQMYDSSCEETFGFAHAAIFQNGNGEDALQNIQPAGMPLPPTPQC